MTKESLGKEMTGQCEKCGKPLTEGIRYLTTDGGWQCWDCMEEERQQTLQCRRQWAEDLNELLKSHQTLDDEAFIAKAEDFAEQWGLP